MLDSGDTMTLMRDTVRFRPASEEDVPFMVRLYASTREQELRAVPWSAEEKEQFLLSQFNAQKLHYDTHYEQCEFLIIEQDGRPIGRLYIDRLPDDIRIIDIALVPEIRGKGLGRILLQEILDEAAASGRSVSIHVEHFNPAMRLYERLGFRHIDTNGVYDRMEWRAGVSPETT
jgi:ribosomal protein S18 acetylase RimI-like enzyme